MRPLNLGCRLCGLNRAQPELLRRVTAETAGASIKHFSRPGLLIDAHRPDDVNVVIHSWERVWFLGEI
jgi:hypothetical protein